MFFLILVIALFIGGMWVQKRYAPKFSFVNNSLTITYKGKHGERITEKIF